MGDVAPLHIVYVFEAIYLIIRITDINVYQKAVLPLQQWTQNRIQTKEQNKMNKNLKISPGARAPLRAYWYDKCAWLELEA